MVELHPPSLHGNQSDDDYDSARSYDDAYANEHRNNTTIVKDHFAEQQLFDNDTFHQTGTRTVDKSSNGMSIFGFDSGDDDDDHDNEQSLLVSPLPELSQYIQKPHNHINNKNNSNQNFQYNQEDVFQSPPRSQHDNNNNGGNHDDSLISLATLSPSPPPSSTTKSQQRLRSSARLRRRREILFSSPTEQKFQILHDDGQDTKKQEIQQRKEEQEKLEGQKPEEGGKVVVQNIVTLIANVEKEEKVETDERKNETLLLGSDGVSGNVKLDTSLCPSLGLGSSSGSYADEGSSCLSTCSDPDKIDNGNVFNNANIQHEDEKEDSVQDNDIDGDNDLSYSSDEGLSSQQSMLENKQISRTNNYEVLDITKKEGMVNDEDTNKSDYNRSSQEQEKDQSSMENLDRSSIQSFLEDLECVYTIPNKEMEQKLASLRNRSNEKSLSDPVEQIHQTPPRASHERKSLTLTPKLKEVVEKTLTPVLNALRAKLLDSKALDHHKGINKASFTTGSEKKKVSFTDDDNMTHLDFKSPTFENSNEERTSLTPALKNLRSKLYHDGRGDSENESDNKMLLNTPGSLENEGSTSNTTNEKIPLDSEISLTPALKALRSKILRNSFVDSMPNTHNLSSISPIPNTNVSPKVIQDTLPNRGSLFSPPEREPTSLKTTPKSGASDNNQSNVINGGDDSYFAQPKDLSSAKKNLNAQSSALVKRLRGAAQRRMVQLTQKRDSLAAKETQHLERKEHDTVMNNIIEEEHSQEQIDSDEMIKKQQPKKKPIINTVFKARPMPSFTKEGSGPSGVPNIIKKATTKPISPKLGVRRHNSSSTEVKQQIKDKENDPFYAPSFKARPIPKCTGNNNIHKGFSKAKKKQVTIPKSPLLGLRRQQSSSKNTLVLDNKHEVSKRNPKQRNRQKVLSPDLVGLTFVSRTPSVNDRENIPPSNEQAGFHLYTSARAKDRAKFNAEFALREKQREMQKRKENELLIKRRIQELESLKKTLR